MNKIIGLILFLLGLILLLDSNITGAVVGLSAGSGFSSIIGVVFMLVGGVLFAEEGKSKEESGLERKLKEIEDVKIRRELLSDALRAEKFAERGYDVNGLWNPNKNPKDNKNHFFNKFYDDVCKEITDGYEEYKQIQLKNNLKFRKFKKFRKEALRMIVKWNDKISSGEFVPLFVEESKTDSYDYPKMKMRVVYYGLKNLIGRSRNFYKNKRKTGKVIAAHEIVNSEAIKEPKKLAMTPHIHWKLEYILRKNYKFI